MSVSGFQGQVNVQPAPAVEGDFAGANDRCSVLAGPGAPVSGPSPRFPIVAHFTWLDQVTGLVHGDFRNEATAKIGFLRRDQQAPLQVFLADAQMYVIAGQILTIFDQGSFWAAAPDGAEPGDAVFAATKDGEPLYGAVGATTVSGNFTAALANTGILTVSAVADGSIKVGDIVTSNGATVPNGVAILAQLSGTPGGIGTYMTSLTGATVASGTMRAHDKVATNFRVDGLADSGELVQISTW